MTEPKLCAQCLGTFNPTRKDQKFCGMPCARANAREKWRTMNPKTAAAQLANNTVAEMNEMRVALDLLARGYEVYRAAVAGMDCDMLIIDTTGFTQRIEVTSGNLTSSGTLQYPRRDESQYDILAVVVGEQIHYKPEL